VFAVLVLQYVHTTSKSVLFVALRLTPQVVDAELFQVALDRTGVFIVAEEASATHSTKHSIQLFINTDPLFSCTLRLIRWVR
jgi:hypothetical protein